MKVRFGVSVISGTAFPHRRDLDKFAELVRIIDGSGVELIGTNDTSFIGGDAYVRATLIAQTAKNARVGIHPPNPLTREPQIMAAFLGSIDAMTEGRAFLDRQRRQRGLQHRPRTGEPRPDGGLHHLRAGPDRDR